LPIKLNRKKKLSGGKMSRFMSLLTHISTWIRQHLLISVGSVLALVLLLWGARSAAFAATHTAIQDCGSLYNASGPRPQTGGDTIGVRQAIHCFVLAHQQCRAASLSYTTHSVDTGVKDTYTTANGLDGCAISGESTFYVVALHSKTTTDFSCSGLIQKPNGLHLLSCGQYGEIVVPTSAAKTTFTGNIAII
jgi:hypothetical protein